MNTESNETASNRTPRAGDSSEEITTLKKELLQAELRLAKARATVTSTEVDIRVLNSRLRAVTR